jgi:hypothetical protein
MQLAPAPFVKLDARNEIEVSTFLRNALLASSEGSTEDSTREECRKFQPTLTPELKSACGQQDRNFIDDRVTPSAAQAANGRRLKF